MLDAALLQQLKQAPERAFGPALQAMGKQDPRAPERELDQAAVALCKRLRREGKHEQALRLAQAGKGRSRALRLEEALAALGLGEQARLRAVLDLDPVLASALAPVLAALDGREAPPQDAPPASALRAGVLAAAAYTARLVRGEDPGEGSALDAPWRASFEAVAALTRGALATTAQAQAAVGALPPAVASVAWQELAERQPEVILEGARMPQPALRRALAAVLRAGTADQAALARWLGRASHRAVDESLRPAAALLEAFGRLGEPAAARHALEVAERAGFEPLEAARARVLIVQQEQRQQSEDDHAMEGGCAAQARAFEGVAREAARLPSGAALAAVAWASAAREWSHAEHWRPCLAAIEHARALAPALGQDTPSFEQRLQQLDLVRLAHESPGEAAPRLDAWLQAHPQDRELWELRRQAAERVSPEEVDEVLRRALAACDDPSLRADCREWLIGRRKLEAFEGLPERPSAELLLRDAMEALPVSDAPAELLAALDQRAAHLPADHRFALELAVLDRLLENDLNELFGDRVGVVAARFAQDALRLGQLAAVLLSWNRQDEARALLPSLRPHGDGLLVEVIKMCTQVDDTRELGSEALTIMLPWLSAAATSEAIAVTERSRRRGLSTPVDKRYHPGRVLAEAEELLGHAVPFFPEDDVMASAESASKILSQLGTNDPLLGSVRMAGSIAGLAPAAQARVEQHVARLSPPERDLLFAQLDQAAVQSGPGALQALMRRLAKEGFA